MHSIASGSGRQATGKFADDSAELHRALMELAPRSDGTGPRCTKPQHAYWIPKDVWLKVVAGLHAWVPPRKLTARPPQRSFQSLLLLIPAAFFGLRSLLQSLDLGLDRRRFLRVLLLGLV